MNLSEIKPPAGQNHKKKRIGRGMGTGHGKTSGRGHKGQHSRSGFSQKRGFEGGQMPLHRRLPKRGFTNIFGKEIAVINIGRLEKLEGDSFDAAQLVEMGVVRKAKDGLKVLANGELTRKITVKANYFSKAAEEKITAAGGTVEKIEAPVRPSTKKTDAAVKPAKKSEAAAKPAKKTKAADKPAKKPKA